MTVLVFVAGFFCGAFVGILILVIVGNKLIRRQLMADQAKLDSQIRWTKEQIAAEKLRQSQRSPR